MLYRLTIISNVTNVGHNTDVHYFDNMYELQDFIEAETFGMNDDEMELYHYNLQIETLNN